MDPHLLQSLNSAQLQAVQHPQNVPLQILAGPGSGKTKVLTSRIAYLITCRHLEPSSICAVTFTNKAANEMRDRLIKLIGKARTYEVKMGTFHALCAMSLRRYGASIGLDPNFTVCDAEESKKIIAPFLKPYHEELISKNITLKESTVLSLISKAKSKGHSPEDLLAQYFNSSNDIELIVANIYVEYEQSLRKSNSLDFDDLLLFGVRLFRKHDKAVQWCKHVLVDEFQDTNTTQYDLMTCLAAAHRCVTIVGDPDQSIYGWRSAEVENLAKMRRDFPRTEEIFLEHNYRSTGSILSASLAIVAQDEARIPKTLYTSHPAGPSAILRSFPKEHVEAAFIAFEIKNIMAHMGGMLNWGDFAILLRFNALSRVLEMVLQKEGIPNRVLKGRRFFERAEIKDLLAYLQLVDNPLFAPALSRAVNVPSRGIGPKTLAQIKETAEKLKLSPFAVIEQICDSKLPDTKPPLRRKLTDFVNCVRTLRRMDRDGASPVHIIRTLIKTVDYEDYLKRTQEDWETRWQNVEELINFASEEPLNLYGTVEEQQGEQARDERQHTPLRMFLQASMLSSDGDDDQGADLKEKVIISTCHAAKGLEWPVVIIPAVEKGVFPLSRSEDVAEERRLLYVACTRAQAFLYLTFAAKRMVAGEAKRKELSDFISAAMVKNGTTFASTTHKFSEDDRHLVAKVLNRTPPDEGRVAELVAEFKRTSKNALLEFEEIPDLPEQDSASYLSQAPLRKFTSEVSMPHPPHDVPAKQRASAVPHRTMAPATVQRAPPVVLPVQSSRVDSRACVSSADEVPGFLVDKVLPEFSSSGFGRPHEPKNIVAATASITGQKRRLGMGRGTSGYTNKKYKCPT